MQETIPEILFWTCAGLVFCVYCGYPIVLAILGFWSPQRSIPENLSFPRVSLIISAFNEQSVLAKKLANSINLNYPEGLLEVVVVSDCSDDDTDDIVKSFSGAGVRLIRQTERLGKTSGLNLAVPQTSGEIIVFSDANALYQSDALRNLVKHFSDPTVGYVVGNARYTDRTGLTASAESEGLYWKLEAWLKQKESRFGSVVGGDGAIYAIRRELFTPLKITDINDLVNPLQIIACGFRGVYEPSAVCYEDAGDSFEKEFRRKIRIISRSLNALRRVPSVLLPWNQFRHWMCLILHKALRWFVPIFLLVIFMCSLLLWRYWLYRLAAVVQAGFYALALVAWVMGPRRSSFKGLYLPYYFCLVNLASLFGIVKFCSGSFSATWQTVRENDSATSNPSAYVARRRL
jgi:cellulose synthase/poly-beta-1,6-N-acetylglucosamine synthase-like glycosyltransferase